jgi:hypothetical protein
MVTAKQRAAARKNIRTVQAAEGRSRKGPGAGGGKFYRIEVRPKSEFVMFRTQDVGQRGHLERVAGKRASGSWDTATWLVAKDAAHVSGGRLVIDDSRARTALKQIRGPIIHKKADVFTARPRRKVRAAAR